MREDISDVFHDRAKAGSRYDDGNKGKKRALQKIDIEDLPKRGPNHKGYKHKDYHSSPVRRFLRSNVGRKWDDVYKEMAEVCDVRSNPQREVLEMVGPEGWMVEHNVIMIDGVPHCSRGTPLRYGYRGALYVHPDTKTLEVIETKREEYRRWKPKPYVKVKDREFQQFHFIEGLWYRVDFSPYLGEAKIPDDIVFGETKKAQNNNAYTPYYWNYFNSHASSTRQTLIDRYGSAMYPVRKTQCGKKEIKKIQQELDRMARDKAS